MAFPRVSQERKGGIPRSQSIRPAPAGYSRDQATTLLCSTCCLEVVHCTLGDDKHPVKGAISVGVENMKVCDGRELLSTFRYQSSTSRLRQGGRIDKLIHLAIGVMPWLHNHTPGSEALIQRHLESIVQSHNDRIEYLRDR